ncbi:MAG: ABC transporter permease, partial [Parcubacteria group bacterium]|nr:ABC transporter permease [Parcubacteria group bacterium]
MNSYALWISYKTITKKEVTRFLRVWSQTLLPPVITMSLYFVIFGKFIGSQISNINGFSYMEFIVPGLVMMSVITSSFMNTISSFYFSKFQKTIEEIMVSPTPYYIVIFGYVTGGVLRGLLTGAIVLAVALFFTHIAIHNILFTLLVVLLTSIIFSLAGLINGVLATS